jgi:hypothetical protein
MEPLLWAGDGGVGERGRLTSHPMTQQQSEPPCAAAAVRMQQMSTCPHLSNTRAPRAPTFHQAPFVVAAMLALGAYKSASDAVRTLLAGRRPCGY